MARSAPPSFGFAPADRGRFSVGAALLALAAVLWVVALMWHFGGRAMAEYSGHGAEAYLAGATVLLLLALVGPMVGATVRTLALHTVTACLRTKVAAVFAVLLAAALATLPLIMKGDGTLTGQVQTFLDYALGITALLLSLTTILLATSVVSSDVEKRRVFPLMTKPVARWQYILGRFLGLCLVNGVLLGLAGLAIWGVAQYQRGGKPLNRDDRRRIETEVFTARVSVSPVPLDIESAVQERVRNLQKKPLEYKSAIEGFLKGKPHVTQGDPAKARKLLEDEVRKDVLSEHQSILPGQSLTWRFEGIRVKGTQHRGRGKVTEALPKILLYRVATETALASRLIYRGPVIVNGVEGRVTRTDIDTFDVRFAKEQADTLAVRKLAKGSEVDIIVDPVIQIRYKVAASGELPGDIIRGMWTVTNPQTGARYRELRTDPEDQSATITPPARVVSDSGETVAVYSNMMNPEQRTKLTILQKDVSALFRVGGFEANFLRGVLLVFLQLMFLAAVGVFAASFASFPVACILSLLAVPISLMRAFLIQAAKLPKDGDWSKISWFTIASHYVIRGANTVLPDFTAISPGDKLVDGVLIPWPNVASQALLTVAFRASVLLVLACLIFQKREMARVQV